MAWTEEQYREFQRERNAQAFADAPRAPKPSKYKNIKTVVDGITFDSKREASYWNELKLREKAGEIDHLERQVAFDLFCPVGDPNDAIVVVVARYVCDFHFRETVSKQWRAIDIKGGKETPMFALKRKWLFLQSGIEIEVIR